MVSSLYKRLTGDNTPDGEKQEAPSGAPALGGDLLRDYNLG